MVLSYLRISFMALVLSLIINLISLPQSQDVASISVIDKSVKVAQGEKFSISLAITVSPTWHINSNKPNDDFLIPSELTARGNGLKLIAVNYPKSHELKLSFSEELVSVYEATSNAKLTFSISQDAPLGKQKVLIKLDYQACNDVSCLPPNETNTEIEVEVVKKSIDEIAEPEVRTESDSTISKFDSDQSTDNSTKVEEVKVETTKDTKSDEGSIASTLENSGLFLSLIFVFLAGLALNLTPCVYPLIPITIGYFGGQSEGKTSRLVMLGLLYMLGMALTYSVVG